MTRTNMDRNYITNWKKNGKINTRTTRKSKKKSQFPLFMHFLGKSVPRLGATHRSDSANVLQTILINQTSEETERSCGWIVFSMQVANKCSEYCVFTIFYIWNIYSYLLVNMFWMSFQRMNAHTHVHIARCMNICLMRNGFDIKKFYYWIKNEMNHIEMYIYVVV